MAPCMRSSRKALDHNLPRFVCPPTFLHPSGSDSLAGFADKGCVDAALVSKPEAGNSRIIFHRFLTLAVTRKVYRDCLHRTYLHELASFYLPVQAWRSPPEIRSRRLTKSSPWSPISFVFSRSRLSAPPIVADEPCVRRSVSVRRIESSTVERTLRIRIRFWLPPIQRQLSAHPERLRRMPSHLSSSLR